MRKLVEINFCLQIFDAFEIELVKSLIKFSVSFKIFKLNIFERLNEMLTTDNLFHFRGDIFDLFFMLHFYAIFQSVVFILKDCIEVFKLSCQIVL